MAEILVDTDILIDHLRGHRRFAPTEPVAYSVVTRAELFAGRSSEEALIDRLLAPFVELSVDRAVAQQAGRLRRETGIRMPDALIAATAVVHDLTLITRNRRDFDGVPRLAIRAPR